MKISPRVGAILFLLWGIVHIIGGATFVYLTATSGTDVALQTMASAIESVSAGTGADVGALLSYHFFNIAWLGLLAVAVAVTLNWKNSISGFWINLAVVGLTDIGLLFFMLLPGTMSWADGSVGIVLGLAAIVFSGAAITTRSTLTTLSGNLQDA